MVPASWSLASSSAACRRRREVARSDNHFSTRPKLCRSKGATSLKITKVETIRLQSRATLIWLRVHTDDGVVGLGESWFSCAAIEADLHDRVAPMLLGQDPSRIEALNRQLRPYVGFTGTSAE